MDCHELTYNLMHRVYKELQIFQLTETPNRKHRPLFKSEHRTLTFGENNRNKLPTMVQNLFQVTLEDIDVRKQQK